MTVAVTMNDCYGAAGSGKSLSIRPAKGRPRRVCFAVGFRVNYTVRLHVAIAQEPSPVIQAFWTVTAATVPGFTIRADAGPLDHRAYPSKMDEENRKKYDQHHAVRPTPFPLHSSVDLHAPGPVMGQNSFKRLKRFVETFPIRGKLHIAGKAGEGLPLFAVPLSA